MRSGILYLVVLSLLALASFSACEESDIIESSNWEPEWAFPLVNSTFTFEDILRFADDGGITTIDSSQLVHIVYSGRVFSLPASRLVDIPDIESPFAGSSGTIPTAFPGLGLVKQMDLKSGQLKISFETLDLDMIQVQMTFPELKLNNNPLVIDTQFMGPGPVVIQRDLTGYGLLAENFQIGYELQSSEVGTGEDADVFGSMDLSSLDFTYLEGRLDSVLTVTPRDTVFIDIYKNQESGVLHFEDFELKVNVNNSIGLPFRAKLDPLLAITNNAGELPIQASILNSGLPFAYPALTEVGQTATTTISLNPDNSNLGEVIAAAPKQIIYAIEAATIPMQNENGFLTDTSTFSVDIEADLPMHLRADGFFLLDTVGFEMDGLEDITGVEEASIRIVTENGYPIDLLAQILLMNEDYQVVDSLLDSFRPLIKAAPVDNQGIVTQPETVSFDIVLPQSRLENLSRASHLEVQFQTQTLQSGQIPVKVLSTYEIGLKVGLKIKQGS
jgi:hypothetical protein